MNGAGPDGNPHFPTHPVSLNKKGALLYSPIDIEGHLGKDGRHYLLDFSRTWPPEYPDEKHESMKAGHLYRLLRPEFVQSYHIPLSPDAYSGFTKNQPDSEENNQSLREATAYLHKVVIPRTASDLIYEVSELVENGKDPRRFNLALWMHRKGTNLRHLGIVAQYMRSLESSLLLARDCKIFCLIEMFARTFKQCLGQQMRQLMRESDEDAMIEWPLRELVVNHINRIFNKATAPKIWKTWFLETVKEKYDVDVNTLVDESDTVSIEDECTTFKNPAFPSSGKLYLLERILKITRIRIRKRTYQSWRSNPLTFEKKSDFMIEADLEEIGERVKHMNIIDHAHGYVLKISSFRAPKEERIDLLQRAKKRFESALKSNPTNRYTLRNLAQVLTAIFDHDEAHISLPSVRLHPLLNMSDKCYRGAVIADPSDVITLGQYATFLLFKGHIREACEYLLRVVEINPTHLDALSNLKWCANQFGFTDVEKHIQIIVSRKG